MKIKYTDNLEQSKSPYDKWSTPKKFKNFSKTKEHEGKTYRIIDKKVRDFSGLERFTRGCIGVALVIGSFGLAFLHKKTIRLFTQTQKTVRFAVPDKDIYKTLPEIIKQNRFTEADDENIKNSSYIISQIEKNKKSMVEYAAPHVYPSPAATPLKPTENELHQSIDSTKLTQNESPKAPKSVEPTKNNTPTNDDDLRSFQRRLPNISHDLAFTIIETVDDSYKDKFYKSLARYEIFCKHEKRDITVSKLKDPAAFYSALDDLYRKHAVEHFLANQPERAYEIIKKMKDQDSGYLALLDLDSVPEPNQIIEKMTNKESGYLKLLDKMLYRRSASLNYSLPNYTIQNAQTDTIHSIINNDDENIKNSSHIISQIEKNKKRMVEYAAPHVYPSPAATPLKPTENEPHQPIDSTKLTQNESPKAPKSVEPTKNNTPTNDDDLRSFQRRLPNISHDLAFTIIETVDDSYKDKFYKSLARYEIFCKHEKRDITVSKLKDPAAFYSALDDLYRKHAVEHFLANQPERAYETIKKMKDQDSGYLALLDLDSVPEPNQIIEKMTNKESGRTKLLNKTLYGRGASLNYSLPNYTIQNAQTDTIHSIINKLEKKSIGYNKLAMFYRSHNKKRLEERAKKLANLAKEKEERAINCNEPDKSVKGDL